MKYRRILMRKLIVVGMAVLMIALVAIPADAVIQMPQPTVVGLLNGPDSVPIPAQINYQGYLTDSGGHPINATVSIVFTIYDAASGGTALWTETQSVSVSNGHFSVRLGSTIPINVSNLTGQSYLGVKVGADAEMTPRQQLVSVAYALRAALANNADTLDGEEAAAFVKKSGDTMTGILNLPTNGLVAGTNQFVLTGGNVGIGTASPGYKLHVEGTIYGTSTSFIGVYGKSSSSHGVAGISTDGYGVQGASSSNYGVHGESTSGIGVYGRNNSNGNYGQLGTPSWGVYGVSTNGWGVYGQSTDGTGVVGFTNSGSHSGVYGQYGSDNYGQLGTSSFGVRGISPSGTGVLGASTSGKGVWGSSSESYGVYGYSYNVSSYDFYAGGLGTNYGPFTGAHEVKLASAFPTKVRPGMIVSVTGETQVRTDKGQINFSSTLPTVQLSNTANDKRVLGVFISESPLPEDHWYKASEGERFGIVNALGDGRVWVTNINGDIEAGDYITTSTIAGYGQKQADDLLHSYTLGKATENVDWSKVSDTVVFNGQTYKAYPIAVVYTSG